MILKCQIVNFCFLCCASEHCFYRNHLIPLNGLGMIFGVSTTATKCDKCTSVGSNVCRRIKKIKWNSFDSFFGLFPSRKTKVKKKKCTNCCHCTAHTAAMHWTRCETCQTWAHNQHAFAMDSIVRAPISAIVLSASHWHLFHSSQCLPIYHSLHSRMHGFELCRCPFDMCSYAKLSINGMRCQRFSLHSTNAPFSLSIVSHLLRYFWLHCFILSMHFTSLLHWCRFSVVQGAKACKIFEKWYLRLQTIDARVVEQTVGTWLFGDVLRQNLTNYSTPKENASHSVRIEYVINSKFSQFFRSDRRHGNQWMHRK